MKRRYNTTLFKERVLMIRKYMPYAFIGIDVIVGFPGESDQDFLDTYNFLKSLKPSFLHIFPYSKRADTPASEFSDQVEESVKTQRVEQLSKLSDELYSQFCNENSGREEEVLFESTQKGGKMFGYTKNYIKVEREYSRELIGQIVRVSL